MGIINFVTLTLLAGSVIVFLYTLRDPFKALLGILPFMIVTRSFDLPIFGERIIVFDMVFMIWFVAVLVRQASGKRDLIIPRSFFWPILIYYLALAGAVISLVNSVSLTAGLQELIIYIYLGVFGLTVAALVNTRERLEKIANMLIVVLAIAVFLALWEAAADTLSLPSLIGVESTHRLEGTFRNTNQLAGFLRTLLPFAWAMILLVEMSIWRRGTLLLISAGGVLMLLLTSSRVDTTATIVEVAILFLVAIFYAIRKRGAILTLGAIFVAAIVLAAGVSILPALAGNLWQTVTWRLLPFLQSIVNAHSPAQFLDSVAVSGAGRQFLIGNYAVSWQAFLDHPFIGTGIGNFGLAYDFVTGRNYEVHSAYLNLLAERGVFGTLWQLLFLGAILFYAVDGLLKKNKIAWLAIALLVSYAGSLISGVYVIFFRRREFWLTVALIASSWHLYSGLYANNLAQVGSKLRRRPLIEGKKPESEALQS